MKRLFLRLISGSSQEHYQRSRGGRKKFTLFAPKEEFIARAWAPGIMFMEACSIEGIARKIRGAGRHSVDCDTFFIVASWENR